MKTVFEVTESINCPLYVRGETMSLTRRSCSCGAGKEVCLVLARDFMNLLVKMQSDPQWHSLKGEETFNCSGKQAIFTILGENNGSYRFIPGLSPADQKAAEIGEFMMLLMEGVQQEDERVEAAG